MMKELNLWEVWTVVKLELGLRLLGTGSRPSWYWQRKTLRSRMPPDEASFPEIKWKKIKLDAVGICVSYLWMPLSYKYQWIIWVSKSIQKNIWYYSGHSNTGLVRFSNGPNMSGCRMVWFLNGWIHRHSKIGHFCPVFEWFGPQTSMSIRKPDDVTNRKH